MKRFNVLNSPVLRRAGLGFVFLLCCAAVALAWFAPPQSAFAFLTGGENPKPKQTAVSPGDKSDASKKTSVSNQQKDGKENSQDGVWRDVQLDSLNMSISEGVPETARVLELNSKALLKILDSAPNDSTERLSDLSESGSILQLPMPDGGFMRFHLADSPVLVPELQEKFPEIRSYRGQSVDDSRVSARLDFSPRGFHATVLTHDKVISIHPAREDNSNNYVVYFGEHFSGAPLKCGVTESIEQHPSKAVDLVTEEATAPSVATGATLRTLRFAIATTGEYYQAANLGGGSYNNTVASITSWINAVNLIYERELAVKFLVVTNEQIVFTDPATDPFTNGNAGTMSDEVQSVLAKEVNQGGVGLANYDIGHVLGKDGDGGVAGIGATCIDGMGKGKGATGLSAPIGNFGSLKVFAHEIGHQFGAPHSFNSDKNTPLGCGGVDGKNRSETAAYEVGSGSTIMAYGNVCGAANLLGDNDMRFHAISLKNMNDHLAKFQGLPACGTTANTGNAAPVVDAGAGYTIPILTPFALTASATDANDDVKTLTYTWDQFDAGGKLYPNPEYGDQPGDPATTTRPIFRPYPATSNPTRLFPSLKYILENANEPPLTATDPVYGGTRQVGEKLPSVTRAMKFRVTARDNRSGGGGTSDDDVTINVTAEAGPFKVTAPNTSVVWTGGSTQTVTWDKSKTDVTPVNTANVKITLSADGGQTFPIVLAASVPNNGTASVSVPNGIQTAAARVKIEAVNNIFFDISDANFTVSGGGTCPIISGIAPNSGAAGTVVTISGVNFTGVSAVKFAGGVNATTYEFVNDRTIKATVPANAGSGAITVVKPSCAEQQTAPFAFCNAAPETMALDDGTHNASYYDAYQVNRLTPSSYPATLTHVQIYFHNHADNPRVGEPLSVVVGTNSDGDTNVNNTAFQSIPATVQLVGDWNTYALPTPLTITQGDFVIGYQQPTNGRKGATDETVPKSRSYFSNDGVNFLVTPVSNYMIRGKTGCPPVPPSTTPTISPGSQNFNASPGNGTIAVTAPSAWTATSNNSWITIAPGASGTGNGSVVYSVAQNNTGAARTGTITVAGNTFTVTQTACAIGFSPSPGTTLGAAGGNFEISVFSPAGCPWSVTNIPSWITVTSGANSSNNGTIKYFVQANTAKTSRTGTLTIGGQTFTVTQNACPDSATMIFDDDVVSLGNGRGYNVVRLTPTSYPATLTHVQIYFDDYWGTTGRNFEILAGKNADGDQNINGSIQQIVPANSGTIRKAYVPFALTTPITITQGDFVVGFKVAEAAGFFPRASETVAPLQSRSYQSGDNGATLVLDPNEDYKIRADYKSYCPDGTISPASRSINGGGTTGTVNVTSSIAWTAVSNDPSWLTVNSGASGTGNGTVAYTVAPNTTGATRTGTITIAGQVFTVTQTACLAAFVSGSATVSSGGGSFTLSVSAACGSWTAASNVAWLTIPPGSSSTGAGTVTYNVAANTTRTPRTATITVAEQTLTVAQNACPDSTAIIFDDDTVSFTSSGTYFVQRLKPTSYPATLTHVQIYFHGGFSSTSKVAIVAGKNEDGDDNIDNSILQTSQDISTGTIRDAYTTFALQTPFKIESGDFVVGFKTVQDAPSHPISVETVAPSKGRAYRSFNGGTIFQAAPANENFKIRAQYQSSCPNSTVSAISPPTFNNNGGSGTIKVTTPTALAALSEWTATSSDPWITVTSVSGDTVGYTIAPNDTGEPRNGSITVAGQVFYIYQAGYGRSIGGTVRYAINNTKTVYGVTLAATGGSAFSTDTSLSGAYLIPGLIEEENYTVTPSKTTDVNGITAFDATLVLRCVAAGQNCALTQNQGTAADTDGQDGVTAFDATQILRFVAANGSNANTGQVGAWKFELPFRTYNNLTTDPTGQDYTAFLMGDVDGDWQHPENSAPAGAASQEAVQKQRLPEVGLSFSGKAGKHADNTQTIPVSLTNHSSVPVSAFSFDVMFNEKIRQPIDMSIELTGTLAEGCAVTANSDIPGRIGVAGACPDSIKVAAGTLLNLRFTAPSIRSKGARKLIELAFLQAPVIQDNEGNRIVLIKTN